MAIAERKWKVAEEEWKRTQQNELTEWVNEEFKYRHGGNIYEDKWISDLKTDLSDGLRLIKLVELLTGNYLRIPHKKPNLRIQKLENVDSALAHLRDIRVDLVNIEASDIVDCKLKPILGLIWTLKCRYYIKIYACP